MKITISNDKIVKINKNPVAFVATEHLGLNSETNYYDILYHLKYLKSKKLIMTLSNFRDMNKVVKTLNWNELLKKSQ